MNPSIGAKAPPPFVSFFVPGKSAPQGSKRHVGRGHMVESSKDLKPWRSDVAVFAQQAMAGRPIYVETALAMELTFVLPRPLSLPKTKPTPPAIKKPDTDKLERAILDALTHVVYDDDSRVIDLHGRKRTAEIGETPGVSIFIAPATEWNWR
ncbi:RusA family crossover junction endodeoxyribonuclease [Mycobacteroides abscessus]|uniref:RusA family crossover junction endodeoxyribonuclease n=1 Tax=Mycobacteroides abscessus TaxID=36809 RepID=UPI001F1E63F7|nr:RusA family crossover junction endodeoxyribonuclease [Mycobacteroides abscessus]DAZ90225.1 TPA_asm: RusA-like resolvase (endonuclease) [Mycobacterium phage prophiFSIL01-1]